MFYSPQLSYCCFTLWYYPLELGTAGKNSKLLPLFCQNPVRLQSFVMGKPEIETMTEKSQPGSGLLGPICILNWSHLMGEASCKHTHCRMITKQHFVFSFFLQKMPKALVGSSTRAAVLYTDQQQEHNQWCFFLVEGSDTKGSGMWVRQVKTNGFHLCYLCSPGPTFSRPCTLAQTLSGKGRSLLKLVRKTIL